jgi:hypothetical protein
MSGLYTLPSRYDGDPRVFSLRGEIVEYGGDALTGGAGRPGSLQPPPPSAKVQPRGKQRRDVRTLRVTVEVRW